MIIDVLLFAAARDLAGQSVCTVQIAEEATVSDLRYELIRTCPNLKSMAKVLLVAVNNRYAGDSQVLCEGDSVACFPPVSGG
ncbi:MAG: MoaD/ThiS family protein [Fuerstiella sp.]|nr:MoaD/ThiS family protein [Fuerstiella sp.]